MIGKKFNLLTVVEQAESKNGFRWKCRCDCGKEMITHGYKLKSGHTKSCGCLKNRPRTDDTKRKISEANRKRIYFNCGKCGKLSHETPSHYKRKRRHFCSAECYSKYRKENLHFTEQNAYKGVRKVGESKQVYHRRYVKNNPERIAHLKARRYARERKAEGSHTLAEWQELKKKHNNKCVHCGEEKRLTKDHIIPLSKGGTDYIVNIQPLCRNCNSRKWTNENKDLLEEVE